METGQRGKRPSSHEHRVQKAASVILSGRVIVNGMHNFHTCEGTMNAKRFVEQHGLLSKQCLFQGCPCLFQQDNTNPHSAHVTAMLLQGKRVRVLK